MTKKIWTIIAAILLATIPVFAETDSEEDSESDWVEVPETTEPHVEYSTNIDAAFAFPLEAIGTVTEVFKVPAMRFDSPLMRDNNITFTIGAALSPVTLEGILSVIWTPVAFLELYTNANVGSGWSLKNNPPMHGLSLNKDNHSKSLIEPVNFTRTFYSVQFGGAFQFDLGALIRHKWAHLVLRIDQFGTYKGVTRTDNLTSWVWKNDAGENRNGLRYNGEYVLGYKMPIDMNFIGMRVETEKTFFTVPDGLDKSDWGEDRMKVVFGPLVSFKLTKDLSLLLLAQWQTRHPYSSAYDEETFYQKKLVNKNEAETVVFKRVALTLTYTIKHW